MIATIHLKEVHDQLQKSRKQMHQVTTDQRQEWGERLVGHEFVCVRADAKINNPIYDASFWEGIVMKPEQDLGVTQPYVVHFRRSRCATMYSKNHKFGQLHDMNVKVPASLDDVTY